MLRRKLYIPRDASGFTLIGTMMSIAIGAIILLAVLSASVFSYQSQRNVRLVSNFVDVINEVRTVMDSDNCSRNISRAIKEYESSAGLINLSNVMVMKPANMTVSNFKVDGTVDQDVLKVGDDKEGILITRLQLVPKGNITAQKALFELVIEAEKTGEVLASRNMKQKLTVFANIDTAGRFVSCGSGGTTVEEKVCGLIAEGDYLYDPATGKCMPRFSKKCYPGTDAFTATCPGGAKAYASAAAGSSCTSTAMDPVSTGTSRTYADGFTDVAWPSHYRCKAIGETAAECVYATGVDTAGAICSVCCKIENFLPASVSGP